MKQIIIRTVEEYHAEFSQPIMRMVDDNCETYTDGFVVSGYQGIDSHHYFSTEEKANTFAQAHFNAYPQPA